MEKTLSSIDIRTASILIDNKWQNVMSVIRLSSDCIVSASARVEDIWGKHGSVHTDEFRIDYKVLAFAEWAALLGEFSAGQLRFAETEVEFGRAVDVGGSLGYVQSKYHSLWPQPEWPMLEGSVYTITVPDASKNPQYRINAENIQRAVSKLGYSSVLDAMTELLGLKISQGLSGFDVFVAVPVMAKISEAVVCPSDGIVKATGLSHPALASFRLFGSFYGNSGAPRERIPFLVEESERSDAVRGFIGKGHVPTSKIYEYLDLKLVHDELGEVYSHTWRTRELIPEQYVNPLYFLLMKFCSASKLHSLVVRPHSVPPQKTKPQKDFEQNVAWVLSCYGFATIVLGAHEDLVAEETKVKRGSLDLLAYHPFRKLVLLGACTLNVPKEEDYSQLVSVRTMLLEDWKGDLPFSCEVVMFTAAPDCPVRSNPTILDSFISLPTDGNVRVIDGNGLSEALRLLQERKEELFFRRFTAMDLSVS
ncbi:MAG: hypothetical protein LAP86_16895 [Acidobacteriia bacterium]|nr:hypothetical protein [Terriglobia bacterium]